MNKPAFSNAAALRRVVRGSLILLTPPAPDMAGKAEAARNGARLLDDVARACLRAGIAAEPGQGLLAKIDALRAEISAEAEMLEVWAALGLGLDDEND